MDNQHYLTAIECRRGRVFLFCQTSRQEFLRINKIICRGAEDRSCFFEELETRTEDVLYRVSLPKFLEKKFVFFVIHQDCSELRVWKPGSALAKGDLPAHFYFTHFLNLAYAAERKGPCQTEGGQVCSPVLRSIICNEKGVIIEGLLFLTSEYSQVDTVEFVCMKFREEDIFFSCPVKSEQAHGEVLPGRYSSAFLEFNQCVVHRFRCELDLTDICKKPGSYNFFLSHAGHPRPLRQIGTKALRKNLVHAYRLGPMRRALFIPYYDASYNRWRMDVCHVSLLDWFRLRLLFRRTRLTSPTRDPNIWLIGEYPTSARDNGMQFYNYVRRHHPEIAAYYIISKGADTSVLVDRENVIYYGSYRHFEISRRAGTLVFSHLPEYLVPKLELLSGYGNDFSAWKTFFLQHGVIAGKRKSLDNLYGTHVRKFDLFFVSSAREKEIVMSGLGYPEEDIRITGLARWDRFKHVADEEKKNILIIPTWRKYLELVDDKTFRKSDFFSCWNLLLTNERLNKFLEKNDIDIVFTLHAALRRFVSFFNENENIHLSDIENIQEHICQCSMMITDFSSISFDSLYQGKPVVYFQFDRYIDEFNYDNQEFDFASELPGPICMNVGEVVESIISYAEKDFILEPIYEKRSKRFFDYHDFNNCHRIFRNISQKINDRVE